MIKLLNSRISLILLFFFIATKSFAINNYDYPKKNLEPGICEKIYSELNFPHPNYELEDPTILKTDLFVDRIYEVAPKNGTFEAQVNLWLTWKELRLIPILKKYNLYTDEKKPFYLCSFDQNLNFSNYKMFDPAVEFYNRKDKPPVENYMSDWIDIFSDGTVDQRLKDVAIFQSDFSFKKFPFDNQKLSIEIWSEFPSNLVRFKPNEPAMSSYKESGVSPTTGEKIYVDGWSLGDIDYETWSYVDKTDNKPYTGFYLYIDIKRLTSYYIYKIILPIIFILIISWSVFWIRGSQLEAKVNVTIVCLLSLIAYNFIIDEDIPKLPYLTFMDTFILVSYFYTGIATILCVYSYLKKLQTGKDISVVDRYARFVGPISYFSILMVSLIYYYNLEGVGAFFRTFLLGPNI
jgi:hypothetical protein